MVAKPFSTVGSGVLVRSCDDSRGAMIAPVGMPLSVQFALLGKLSVEIDDSNDYGSCKMDVAFESDRMDIEV